jgi:hypothetical protein
MIVVDREDFRAWTNGILFERNKEGACIVGDKKIHETAKEEMDRGRTIGLTKAGQIVSHMRLVDGRYQETPIE